MARFWQQWYQRWLARRVPPAQEVTLDSRRIFIFPGRYGAAFLLLALVLFIGGINYQNNLVMGFSFLLFSLFCMTIWHTFRNLAHLQVRVAGMEPGYAGTKGRITLHLQASREHAGIRLYWLADAPVDISLAAGEESRIEVAVPLKRRGWNRPGRLRVESGFPLGLFRAWCLLDMDSACLAWPSPLPGGECPASGGDDREGQQHRTPGGDDFYGLRDYQPGDSLHHIDWKAYARGHGLNVQEYVDPVEGRRLLEWERLPSMAVEQRLSRLCYWAQQLEMTGKPWGLVLPGQVLAPASGQAHLHTALTYLGTFGEDSP